MNTWFTSLWEQHQTLLGLYVFIGTMIGLLAVRLLLSLHPTLREMQQLNKAEARKKQSRSYYWAIQKRSGMWGLLALAVLFGVIFPFSLTPEPQPWWGILLDSFIILMVYDFFYYFVHRFLFHGKLLKWVHAVHHQQKNPCRQDSNYLHPLEACIGISLFGATIAILAAAMGGFHVATAIVTFVLFLELNWLNHDLIENDNVPVKYIKFPVKYIKRISYMHHVHHSKFTSGNFATISSFYDWLFGTYDTGNGWGKNRKDAPDDA